MRADRRLPRRLRPLLASLVAAGVLVLYPTRWGLSMSFAVALPVTALLGGWLTQRTRHRAAPAAVALLLCGPAIGAQQMGLSFLEVDAAYLPPHLFDVRVLALCAQLLDPLPALLLAASLSSALVGARGGALALLLGGAATLGCDLTLEATLQAVQAGQHREAAWLSNAAPAWSLLPLLSLLAMRRTLAGLLLLVTALCTASLARSPLGPLLPPPPPLPAGLPQDAPGLPVAGVPLSPDDPRFPAQLQALGYWPQRELWWCDKAPGPQWASQPRNTVTLALPADAPIDALVAAMPQLVRRGVERVALQGQAPPLPGPLGARLSQPTARFILAPPPAAPLVIATADGPRWLGAPPDGGPCVLQTYPEMTIGALYAIGRALGDSATGSCPDAVSLSLHSQPPGPTGWRPPLPCQID